MIKRLKFTTILICFLNFGFAQQNALQEELSIKQRIWLKQNNFEYNGKLNGGPDHVMTSPEQDCNSAIPVCQNVYSQPVSYSGYGNQQEVPSSSCLASQEKNSVWYIFTVTASGNLMFQITPVSSSDDYDFALYNITGLNCSNVANGSASEVNCNYSATPGNTGLQSGQTNTSQGADGTNQNAPVAVTVGQTYVLVVSNYSSTQSGYTLDFSTSTASIFDNIPPAPQSVFAPCGQTSLTLQMSEAVTCASVASNGTDFTITGPGGPFTVSSANGVNCGTASSQVTVNFSPALQLNQTYTLTINNGTDANTLIDNCGNAAAVGSNVTFSVSNPPASISGPSSVCNGSSVALTASNGTAWSWSPGGFTTQTINVSPTSNTTYSVTVTNGTCGTSSTTHAVTVNASPDANFTINPNPACAGQSVTFTNTSTLTQTCIPIIGCTNNPANMLWYYGDGPTSFDASIAVTNPSSDTQTHTYSTPGTYTVTLQASVIGGCSNTQTMSIVVNAGSGPISASSDVSTVCPGQPATLTASGGSSYTWTGPSGFNSTSNPVTVNPTTTSTYTVSSPGCSGTNTASVTITVSSGTVTTGPISGPSNACPNATSITYSVTNTAGSTYNWTVPSGATITAGQGTNSITVDFGASGGNVAVTETATCGTGNATLAVTVSSTPVTSAIFGPTTVCPNATSQTYSVTNTSGDTYAWTVPAGATITSGQGTNTITVDFGASGGSIDVTETSPCGVGAPVSISVAVSSTPLTSAISGPDPVCANTTSQTYSVTNNSGNSYAWTVPAGASVTAGQGTNSITVDFGTSGGNISVTETSTCGSGAPVTMSVTINAAPATPVISGPSAVCANATSQTYSVTNNSGSSYTWAVPSGATITAGQGTNSITVDFGSTAGSVDVTESNTCGSANATQAITINTIPVTSVITGPVSVCANATSQTYSVTNNAGSTYAWTVPTGATITSGQGTNSVTVDFGTSSGSITVTESVSCGSASPVSTSVTVIATPVTSAISGPSPVCANATSQTYSVTNNSGNTYAWTVPTGATITSGQGTNSIVVDFGTASGSVSVTESNSCGNGSPETFSVTVNSVPTTPVISGSAAVCANATSQTYSVTNNTGDTYAWTVPSGATITSGQGTNSINVNFGSTAGTVSVTESNSCGASPAANYTVSLNPATVTSAITGLSPVCAGQTGVTYSVTNTSTSTYNWTVPSGASIASGQGTNSITVDFGSSSGNITVTETGICGAGTPVTYSVTVNQAPSTPVITGTTAVCISTTGESYSVVNNTGSSYAWTSTGGITITNGASTNSITADFGISGGTLQVVETNSCGTSNASITVAVNSATILISPSASSVCSGFSSTLTASGATTYTWTPSGSLNTTSGASVVATPTATTTYTVVGTDASTGCVGAATATVTLLPPLTINLSSTSSGVCNGTNTTITASGATNYVWSPASSLNTSSGSQVLATPSVATTYTVTGTTPTCSGTGTITINVTPIPTISLTPSDVTICEGDSTEIDASGATNYAWAPNSNFYSLNTTTNTSVVVYPPTSTTYTVIGSMNGCNNSAMVNVTVLPKIVADAGPNDTICLGEKVTLHGTGGTTYMWAPSGSLATPTNSFTLASPVTTTLYTLTTSYGGQCPQTDTIRVVVNPLPSVNAGKDTTIDVESSVVLAGFSNTPTIMWDNASTLNCASCITPVATPTTTTTYILMGANQYGCESSDTVTIYVSQEYALYVPNAFTPNQDFANEAWKPEGFGIKHIEIYVYNRWGQKLFEAQDLDTGWNGYYKGQLVQMDVYVYKIAAETYSGNKINKAGHITLIR